MTGMHSLFDRALVAARQLGASDVHLKAGLAPVLRIDGLLRTLSDVPPLSREFIHSLALSLLNDRRREILERTGDVALSITAADGSRQRVQVWQYRGGVAMTARLVPAQVPTLEMLELPAAVTRLLDVGPGLVLVAGGAGAGKTTTLAALVDRLGSDRACHILTIEDPVELLLKDRHSVVIQREVGLDAPSAAAALRAALRQDADVIAIGDLRDGDSVELALTAAETGHLVLAGVGARDAVTAIARTLDLAEVGERAALRARLAAALRGVVAQQLVPRTSGKGRVAAVELLLLDDEARAHVRDPQGEAALALALADGRPPGNLGFDASLVALARARRISVAMAVARASDPAAVGQALEDHDGRSSVQPEVEDDARPD
jgi:twitching motility protein PilT